MQFLVWKYFTGTLKIYLHCAFNVILMASFCLFVCFTVSQVKKLESFTEFFYINERCTIQATNYNALFVNCFF